MNTLIQPVCIKLIKSDGKYMYNFTPEFFFIFFLNYKQPNYFQH